MQVNGLTGTIPAANAKTTSPAQILEENGNLFCLLLQSMEQSVEGTGEGSPEGSPPNPDDPWDERQAALGVVCAMPAPVPDAAQEMPQEESALPSPAVGTEGRAAPPTLPNALWGRVPDAAGLAQTNVAQLPDTEEIAPPAETAAPAAPALAETVQTEVSPRKTAQAPAAPPQTSGTQTARPGAAGAVRQNPAETLTEFAAQTEPALAPPEAPDRPNATVPTAPMAGEEQAMILEAAGETGEATEAAPVSIREEPRKPLEVRNTTGFASPALRFAHPSQIRTEETQTSSPVEPPASQVATEIVSSLRQRKDHFTLRLKPEGLGEVTVRLAVRENSLQIRLRSESAAATEMIAAQLDLLHTGLRTAGYNVEQLVMENFAQSSFGAATEQFGRNRQPPAFGETEAKSRKEAPELSQSPNLRPVYRSGTIHYRI